MSDQHALILAREYLDVIANIRSGQFTTDEIYQLDSERQLLHNDLCRILGYDRNVDMYRVAQMLLRDGGYDA